MRRRAEELKAEREVREKRVELGLPVEPEPIGRTRGEPKLPADLEPPTTDD